MNIDIQTFNQFLTKKIERRENQSLSFADILDVLIDSGMTLPFLKHCTFSWDAAERRKGLIPWHTTKEYIYAAQVLQDLLNEDTTNMSGSITIRGQKIESDIGYVQEFLDECLNKLA